MLTRIDAGRPGRLTINVDPRMPAVCRDRIAVSTCFRLSVRISSPNPGISRGHAAMVASRRIAWRRPGAAGREYQRAFFAVGQTDQRVAHAVDAIGNQPPHRTPRRRQHVAQKFLYAGPLISL